MYAWEQAARHDYQASQLPAWAIAKAYYVHGFSYHRVSALHEACCAEGLNSPFSEWIAGWDEESKLTSRVTTRVHCADYFEIRDDALRAHATQIDPGGSWFAVPLEIQRRVWPTEDYELAASRIQLVDSEDDLFAGLVGN